MTRLLPPWIERLLGIQSGAGEGTVWTIDHAWPLPPWATVLLIVLLLLSVVPVYWRTGAAVRLSTRKRLLLSALRIGWLTVLLLMVAQVGLSLKKTGLPYLAILLDNSASMSIVDAPTRGGRPAGEASAEDRAAKTINGRDPIGGRAAIDGNPGDVTQDAAPPDTAPRGPSRWDAAIAAIGRDDGRLLRELADRYKVLFYTLEDTDASVIRLAARPPDEMATRLRQLGPTVPATRLGGAITIILDDLRGNDPAAVVFLSDGINTLGPDLTAAADAARRRGVPLMPIGVGSEHVAPDLALQDVLVDDVVYVGDVLGVSGVVVATGLDSPAGSDHDTRADRTNHPGDADPLRVKVRLIDAASDEVLAERDVALPALASASASGSAEPEVAVQLSYRPTEPGELRLRMEVEPLAGETRLGNNHQTRRITVSDEPIRVLLVQDYPSFEYRYLANALTRGETGVQLDVVLQQASPELVRDDDSMAAQPDAPSDVDGSELPPLNLRSFPLRREELFAYDVVILGDADPGLLSTQALADLAAFVDRASEDQDTSRAAPAATRGGALVLLAGPRFMPRLYSGTPLERVMPCDPTAVVLPPADEPLVAPLQILPTALGRSMPAMWLAGDEDRSAEIWAELAPIYWLARLPQPRPGTRVLAACPQRPGPDGQPSPVICLQYVGAGRVLMHATDETWRWRWRFGDRYFQRYWLQMLRFLARGSLPREQEVLLTTDRRQYESGRPVRLRAVFTDPSTAPAGDDGVTVVLQQGDRRLRRVRMQRQTARRGVFEATVDGVAIGQYDAWLALPTSEGEAASTEFEVIPPLDEFSTTKADLSAMRRAAHESGGTFHRVAEIERLFERLPPGRQVPIEVLPTRPLWNSWPVLLLLVVLTGTEWLIRKRAGLA